MDGSGQGGSIAGRSAAGVGGLADGTAAPGRAGSAASRGTPSGRPAARGAGGAARAGKASRSGGFADGPPPDEPPFDPDYDKLPTGKATYEGFDPGDEPLDDASTVRETSEEQAIRVLTEHFGAEKITGEGKPQR
jgi:DNA polymerase-3 subunit gamma/tau